MDNKVDEVLSVCPDLRRKDVLRDLAHTKSVEATINRIFDGRFLEGVENTPPEEESNSSWYNHQPEDPIKHRSSGANAQNYEPKPATSGKRLYDDLDGNTGDQFRELGNAAYKEGDRAKALDWYKKAVARCPTDQKAWCNMAQVYLTQNAWKRAVAACDKCLAVDPSFLKAYLRKAQAQQQLQQPQQAADTYRLGLRHCTDTQTQAHLTKELRALGDLPPTNGTKPPPPAAAQKRPPPPSPAANSESNPESDDILGNPAPKKARLTEEEKARREQEKQAAKAAKEREREEAKRRKEEEKERAKLERAADRERQKAEKDDAKKKQQFVRQMERQATRNPKDSELFQGTTVVIDTTFLEQNGDHGLLLASLQKLETKWRLVRQPIPCSVSFLRTVRTCDLDTLRNAQAHSQEELPDGVINEQTVEEEDVIVVVSGRDFSKTATSNSIGAYVESLRSAYPNKRVSLMVEGLPAVYKAEADARKKAFRERVLDSQASRAYDDAMTRLGNGETTKDRTETALLELQLDYNMQVTVTSGAEETTQMVVAYTKGIALAPIRKFNEDFKFCTEGRKKHSQPSLIFKAQLQEIMNLSEDVATAVVEAYPTHSRLRDAFLGAGNDQAGVSLVANLMVKRALGPPRRVGPALAEKIYRNLMSNDPSLPCR